jgi:hypothetical protein
MANKFYTKLREDNPSLPARIGEKWTDAEETDVLNEIAEGVSTDIIAQSRERTHSSIKNEIEKKACAIPFLLEAALSRPRPLAEIFLIDLFFRLEVYDDF